MLYLENSIEPDNKTERSKAQQMARRDPRREEDLGERFSQFASAHGTVVGNDLRSDNDTPALNALKALRGAPISMGRGEIPVELWPKEIPSGTCRQPSVFCLFSFQINLLLFCLRIVRKLSISSRQTRNGALQ